MFLHSAINPFLLPISAAALPVVIEDEAIYLRVYTKKKKNFLNAEDCLKM